MKRIFIAIMICIFATCVSSCSEKKSPEKMLEQSQELNWDTIEKSISDNKAKAVEEYENKLFNYTASVMSIEENYIFSFISFTLSFIIIFQITFLFIRFYNLFISST